MHDNPAWKFDEGDILDFLRRYIAGTYDSHYNTKNNLQCVDVLEALDLAAPAYHANILKYAMRYGKKGGTNLADLLKVVHYAILLIRRNHLPQIKDTSPHDRASQDQRKLQN